MPEQSPLSHGDLYHTGFVVDDLNAAKEEVGSLLGLSWIEGGGTVRLHTADGSSVVETKYAVSTDGPHHVELVQSVPGTLYRTAGSARAHHIGYWVDDVQAASAALEKRGLPSAAGISIEGSRRGLISAYHHAGEGFYIEIVARSMKSMLFPQAAQR